MATICKISSEQELNDIVKKNDRKLVILYFEASWANECTSMNPILEQYGKDVDFANVVIGRIDAEQLEALAAKFNVEMVPSFLFFKQGKTLEKLSGFNPPELNRMIQKCLDINTLPDVAAPPLANNGAAVGTLEDRLKKLIGQNKVMVFMKGSPDAPRCGFSRQLVAILNDEKASFGHFDILTDETVRQGLKEFSNWPTYPQLYVNGELVGGLDIIKELKASGELSSMLVPEA